LSDTGRASSSEVNLALFLLFFFANGREGA